MNLLFVGKINNRKNTLKLIYACDLLIERGYNIRLNIAGERSSGKVYRKVKKLIMLII